MVSMCVVSRFELLINKHHVMSRKRTSSIWTLDIEKFEHLVQISSTYKEVLLYFGLENKGNNFKTVKARILEHNIDDSHILFNKNNQRKLLSPPKPLSDILVKNSLYANNSHLRKRLIKEGYLENICYECGQAPIWNGKPLVLQLDHINGNHTDNRVENLRILCPHCHSQTSTFSGKRFRKPKLSDNPLWRNRDRFDTRKVNRPTKDELKKLISEHPWTKIGKMFGVSDNAIRKWAKRYNIGI